MMPEAARQKKQPAQSVLIRLYRLLSPSRRFKIRKQESCGGARDFRHLFGHLRRRRLFEPERLVRLEPSRQTNLIFLGSRVIANLFVFFLIVIQCLAVLIINLLPRSRPRSNPANSAQLTPHCRQSAPGKNSRISSTVAMAYAIFPSK